MSVKQTQLFVPPTRAKALAQDGTLAKPYQQYLFTLQYLLPLILVDTTSGNVVIALPPAGLNATTGQSNQNMEITYRKTSVDGNTATITGSPDGNQVLNANTGANSVVKLKSDGTSWWVTKWP